MNYLKFDLHQQNSGAVVEVRLSGVESDVFLVDSGNLRSFEGGGRYQYYGGHYKASPVRLRIPTPGHWTAVVIPKGGRVDASVRVL